MRRATQTVLALLLLISAASCGAPPPVEGHHIALRFVSIDTEVLDRVELRFETQGMDEQFMMIEPMDFADGAIQLSIEGDRLLLSIAGSHINQFAVDQGDGSSIFDLEVFSDDSVARSSAPSVRVVGLRGTEQIAEGFLFLPSWPLPLATTSNIRVQCRPAALDRCVR